MLHRIVPALQVHSGNCSRPLLQRDEIPQPTNHHQGGPPSGDHHQGTTTSFADTCNLQSCSSIMDSSRQPQPPISAFHTSKLPQVGKQELPATRSARGRGIEGDSNLYSIRLFACTNSEFVLGCSILALTAMKKLDVHQVFPAKAH